MNGLATAQLRAAVEFALRPDFVRIHGALIHPVGRIDRTIQLARHVNKESCLWLEDPQVGAKSTNSLVEN